MDDIIVIGGGASGMMAAYSAAATLASEGREVSVTLLEKNPRPARKIMISGKGRCNFTNLKEWNEFSLHVRSKPNALKPSFFNLPPQAVIGFFEEFGVPTVVERGDRAFPQSRHASDIVDALVLACRSAGVRIETETEVTEVLPSPEGFSVRDSSGRTRRAGAVIVATGGLSYPGTGSTGDGLRWAAGLGHRIVPTFPSLTALVPAGYKTLPPTPDRHLDRSTPLSALGEALCGVSLKNVALRLLVEGLEAGSEFGDIDFTDGGIEGPVGFQLSRKAVKSLVNGSRVAIEVDLKPGVPPEELRSRVDSLWAAVLADPRSRNLRDKEKLRILLGKLMPWELIPGFVQTHPGLLVSRSVGRGRKVVTACIEALAPALQCWRFEIAGYVGYERCVVTAGGVSTDDIVPKTLESRVHHGLYFCGEVLDLDADTGGFNLQIAFSTGALAGRSAALALG